MEVQGFRTEMLSRLPRCGWEERERRLGPRARPPRARGWERLLAAEFDWSSDVCSSDLTTNNRGHIRALQ